MAPCGEKTMMSISSKIGRVVIFLKLYRTTSDLVGHVSKCILDAEITHSEISARLEKLKENTVQCHNTKWEIKGKQTVSSAVCDEIVLQKQSLEETLFLSTLQKIPAEEIINGIAILQANKIIHVNGDIIRPVWHELQFLKTEAQR